MCVQETILVTEYPSVGASVQCYDKDSWGDDEKMGDKQFTGSDGCATITYENRRWDFIGRSPDIYCTASKDNFC